MIKNGDIVRVNVKLTATAIGHDVRCEYKRPLDGSTRPVYIPQEILEVVAAKAEECKPASETDLPRLESPEDPESAARTELKGKAPVSLTAGIPELKYHCAVCGRGFKQACHLGRHNQSCKPRKGKI